MYDGEWKNDKRDGKGIMIFANGGKYEGEWKGDLMNGKGTYFFQNGDVFHGVWVYGKPEGNCNNKDTENEGQSVDSDFWGNNQFDDMIF